MDLKKFLDGPWLLPARVFELVSILIDKVSFSLFVVNISKPIKFEIRSVRSMSIPVITGLITTLQHWRSTPDPFL